MTRRKSSFVRTAIGSSSRATVRAGLKPVLTSVGLAFLAACGGDEDEVVPTTGGPVDMDPSPTPSIPVLAQFFVENFEAFEAVANALVENDERYLLQEASEGWFSDINNDGAYDPEVDVALRSNPIRHAGIQYAHAAGLTGQGQIIAISDSGFLLDHEATDGRIIHQGQSLTVDDHGTFVASVVAGDSKNMIGVAPEAQLILGMYDSFEQLTETVQMAEFHEAIALNNSWGYIGVPATEIGFNNVFSFANSIEYLDSIRSYSQDGIVLFAVSNDYNLIETGIMAGLPVLERDLEKSWLAVINGVPTMVDGDIISANRVSGACLDAAAWCIAADGSWTGATASAVDHYEFGTGTSFATPTVAGALALLAEAFPEMSAQDLRTRLLASADNEFAGFNATDIVELVPGFSRAVSEEWGHGFLDVAAALEPIGTVATPLIDGSSHDADDPLLISGDATGDAVIRALNDINVVGEDRLSGAFYAPAASLVAHRVSRTLLGSRLEDLSQGPTENCCDVSAFFAGSAAIPVPTSGPNVHIFAPIGPESSMSSIGFAISEAIETQSGVFEVGFGVGGDTGRLMPYLYSGSDGQVSALFASYEADLSRSLTLNVSLGVAKASQDSERGLHSSAILNTAGLSIVQTGAFARQDRLTFSVSAPVAVSVGQADLSLPVEKSSYGYDFQEVTIDLAPKDREYRFSIDYEVPVSRYFDARVSLEHVENRGSFVGERETGILVGFSAEF